MGQSPAGSEPRERSSNQSRRCWKVEASSSNARTGGLCGSQLLRQRRVDIVVWLPRPVAGRCSGPVIAERASPGWRGETCHISNTVRFWESYSWLQQAPRHRSRSGSASVTTTATSITATTTTTAATPITAIPITTTTTTVTPITAIQTADTPITTTTPITTALLTEHRQFVLMGTTAIIPTRVRPMATTDRAILSAAFS
jgi:hypothetical protein